MYDVTVLRRSARGRYAERGGVAATHTNPSALWGKTCGAPGAAAAMIDRLVHHAEILSLKGDSYRLRDKKLVDHRPRSSAQPALG